jgi:hypothetical protein
LFKTHHQKKKNSNQLITERHGAGYQLWSGPWSLAAGSAGNGRDSAALSPLFFNFLFILQMQKEMLNFNQTGMSVGEDC